MNLKRSSKISLTLRLMHKPILTIVTTLALTVLLATAMPAVLIVDTGVATNEPGGALFGWQWYYGQITTSQDYIITGVFGYISSYSYDDYPVTLTLSSDSGGGWAVLFFPRISSLHMVKAGRAFQG